MKKVTIAIALLFAVLALAGCPRPPVDEAAAAAAPVESVTIEAPSCVNSCPRGWLQHPYPDCSCHNPFPTP